MRTLLAIGIAICLATSSQAQFRRGGGGCSSCSGGSCGAGGCGPGGCGPGGCSMGGYQVPSYLQPSFTRMQGNACNCAGGNCPADCVANGCNCSVKWVDIPGTTQKAKYINNAQVGAWDESSKIFRTYNSTTKTWGQPVYQRPADLPATADQKPTGAAVPATTAPPASAKPSGKSQVEATQTKAKVEPTDTVGHTDEGALKEWQVNGFQWVPPTENMTWESGVRTPEAKVFGGNDLPDYSTRKRIVVVSPDAGKRKAIAKQLLESSLGQSRDVQEFAPEAWQVKPFKLDEDEAYGRTQLALLELGPVQKDGTAAALHLEHSFDGVDSFGRKIDPDFRPSKVPSSEKASLGGDPLALFIGIGFLVGILFLLMAPTKSEPEGEPSYGV